MKKMLTIASFALASLSGAAAHATFDLVTTPEQMTACLKTYIENWIVAPATVSSWEHRPEYEFLGGYFHASWHTDDPDVYYGMIEAIVGAKSNSTVYCNYPTDAAGMPDRANGFCKAKVAEGSFELDYRAFRSNGQNLPSKKKIAVIRDSKIHCLNIARP